MGKCCRRHLKPPTGVGKQPPKIFTPFSFTFLEKRLRLMKSKRCKFSPRTNKKLQNCNNRLQSLLYNTKINCNWYLISEWTKNRYKVLAETPNRRNTREWCSKESENRDSSVLSFCYYFHLLLNNTQVPTFKKSFVIIGGTHSFGRRKKPSYNVSKIFINKLHC